MFLLKSRIYNVAIAFVFLCNSMPGQNAFTYFAIYLFFNQLTRLAADIGSSSGNGVGGARLFSGTFDCLRSTYKYEGVKGIYSGFSVSLAGKTAVDYIYML